MKKWEKITKTDIDNSNEKWAFWFNHQSSAAFENNEMINTKYSNFGCSLFLLWDSGLFLFSDCNCEARVARLVAATSHPSSCQQATATSQKDNKTMHTNWLEIDFVEWNSLELNIETYMFA